MPWWAGSLAEVLADRQHPPAVSEEASKRFQPPDFESPQRAEICHLCCSLPRFLTSHEYSKIMVAYHWVWLWGGLLHSNS